MRPTQGSLLVAAAIVAMILTACTSGGRTTAPKSTPASSRASQSPTSNGSSGVKPPPPNYRAELSRPLHFPVLRPGQSCLTSRGIVINGSDFGRSVALGPGPVHPLGADGVANLISRTQQPGWLALKTLWVSEPRYQGPFLVRIQRIDGGGPAGLLENPRLTSFYVPPGPTALGTDGYREITGATWVKTPGCIAWQVDGLTFSNIIIVRTVCRALPPLDCVMPTEHPTTPTATKTS